MAKTTPFFACFLHVIEGHMSRTRDLELHWKEHMNFLQQTFKPFCFLFLYSYLKCISCSSSTSGYFHLEHLSLFLFNLSHKNFWTFSGRALELLATNCWTSPFYSFFLIRNAHHAIHELLAIIHLNFSLFRFINEKSLSFL